MSYCQENIGTGILLSKTISLLSQKDKDFYHLINTFWFPPKVIWITIGNCKNKEVFEFIEKNILNIRNFIDSSFGLLILDKK